MHETRSLGPDHLAMMVVEVSEGDGWSSRAGEGFEFEGEIVLEGIRRRGKTAFLRSFSGCLRENQGGALERN